MRAVPRPATFQAPDRALAFSGKSPYIGSVEYLQQVNILFWPLEISFVLTHNHRGRLRNGDHGSQPQEAVVFIPAGSCPLEPG